MPDEKRTLLDIHDEIQSVLRLVDYNDGELTDEIEIKLSELELESREKIMSVCAWFKTLDMEIEGVKKHKKEVSERLKGLENLKERLRRWIFKGAKLAGFIRGNERDGWEGDKVQNAQLKLSWRRSEGVELNEEAHGFEEMPENFPEFFDFKVRVKDHEAGMLLIDLIKGGMLELMDKDFRKSVAADYLKKSKVQVSGVELVKRINPQIK